MNGLLESIEVLLTILMAFGFGIGSGYASIRLILIAFRPKIDAQTPVMPLETVGAVRQ